MPSSGLVHIAPDLGAAGKVDRLLPLHVVVGAPDEMLDQAVLRLLVLAGLILDLRLGQLGPATSPFWGTELHLFFCLYE